jgi:hypothetical protein
MRRTTRTTLGQGFCTLVRAIILASVFGWNGAIAGDDFVPGRVFHCDGFDVAVHSADPADAKIACEGAHAAIDFLVAQGLEVVDGVLIHIVPELPPVVGSSASGCYLESEKRVFVLPYSEFEKFETWFNLPIDASLYRSLVSHEVAHALGACNFRIDTPSIQAKEYIAYVTQLATMAPPLRGRVMAQFPGQGYEGDWQMRTSIYLMDPMRFGVQAYRHFLKPGNGRDYLHAILDGKVMLE